MARHHHQPRHRSRHSDERRRQHYMHSGLRGMEPWRESDRMTPGFDDDPRQQPGLTRGGDWEEDRYAYPEAARYEDEMRQAGAFRPRERFAGDEQRQGWHNPPARGGYGQMPYGSQRADTGFDDWRESRGGYGANSRMDTGNFDYRTSYAQDSGRHAGMDAPRRMPKGYTRSDERIKDDLSERLYYTQGIDVSDVGIEVKNGAVTLSGTVPDRRMKHRIEDACEMCIGVKEVENRIRVRSAFSGEESERSDSSPKGSGPARH